MDCPYCGEEMTPGYIESRDGLAWNGKKVLIKALVRSAAELPLGKSVEVYNCWDRHKLVAAYDCPPKP